MCKCRSRRRIANLKALGRDSSAKMAVNFILGEMAAQMNELGIPISKSAVKPGALAGLIDHVAKNEISISTAKKLFPKLWENSAKPVRELVEDLKNAPPHPAGEKALKVLAALSLDTPAGDVAATSTATVSIANLWQVSNSEEIEKLVEEVLTANAKQVADYRAGKEKAFNSLVGQVMKASKGKANPAQVNEILRRKLGR